MWITEWRFRDMKKAYYCGNAHWRNKRGVRYFYTTLIQHFTPTNEKMDQHEVNPFFYGSPGRNLRRSRSRRLLPRTQRLPAGR